MCLFCLIFSAQKIPILIFSGGADGDIVKWEKQQLSTMSFDTELLTYRDALGAVKMTEDEKFARAEARRQDRKGLPAEEGEVMMVSSLFYLEFISYM